MAGIDSHYRPALRVGHGERDIYSEGLAPLVGGEAKPALVTRWGVAEHSGQRSRRCCLTKSVVSLVVPHEGYNAVELSRCTAGALYAYGDCLTLDGPGQEPTAVVEETAEAR